MSKQVYPSGAQHAQHGQENPNDAPTRLCLHLLPDTRLSVVTIFYQAHTFQSVSLGWGSKGILIDVSAQRCRISVLLIFLHAHTLKSVGMDWEVDTCGFMNLREDGDLRVAIALMRLAPLQQRSRISFFPGIGNNKRCVFQSLENDQRNCSTATPWRSS